MGLRLVLLRRATFPRSAPSAMLNAAAENRRGLIFDFAVLAQNFYGPVGCKTNAKTNCITEMITDPHETTKTRAKCCSMKVFSMLSHAQFLADVCVVFEQPRSLRCNWLFVPKRRIRRRSPAEPNSSGPIRWEPLSSKAANMRSIRRSPSQST